MSRARTGGTAASRKRKASPSPSPSSTRTASPIQVGPSALFKRRNTKESEFSALVRIPSLQRESTLQSFSTRIDGDGWTQDAVTLNYAAPLSIETMIGYENPAPTLGLMPWTPTPSAQALLTVSFPEDRSHNKGYNWAFSDRCNQVFVKMGASCPVQIDVRQAPEQAAVIRIAPRFKKTEHSHMPVKRCPTHLAKDADKENAAHVLRVQNRETQYSMDDNGHCSCSLPLRPDELSRVELFQLMCYSSCAGGIHRRPFELVFTLEVGDHVVASRSILVRVCACPIRDLRIAEDGPKAIKRRTKAEVKDEEVPPSVVARASLVQVTAIGTRGPLDEQDSTVYDLRVVGMENYTLVRKIASALNCLDTGGTDQEQEEKQRKQKDAQANNGPSRKALAAVSSVNGWLEVWSLSQYSSVFQANGYDDLEVIEHLTDKDLKGLQVAPEDCKRLLYAARQLLVVAPQSYARHNLVPQASKRGEKLIRVTLSRNPTRPLGSSAPSPTSASDTSSDATPMGGVVRAAPVPAAATALPKEASPALAEQEVRQAADKAPVHRDASLPMDSQTLHSGDEFSQIDDSQVEVEAMS